MKTTLTRTFASGFVAVALALLPDWWLVDPGPWPVIVIAVCAVLGVTWAIHGALPEIRRMREENERAREAFLQSRGRR